MSQTIQVRYFKYSQHPHLEFPARIVAETEDYVATLVANGTVCTHHTRGISWTPKWDTIAFWYKKDRYYSIHCGLDESGNVLATYCNVNTPYSFDGEILSMIDLDLDVTVEPDLSWQVVDEDEFLEHREKYGYPPELIHAAEAAVQEIIGLIVTRSHPFSLSPADFQALRAVLPAEA